MNPRAPFRFASFAIKVASKIRFCRECRYKYGCLEISWGDATERDREPNQIVEGLRKKKYRINLDCIILLGCVARDG